MHSLVAFLAMELHSKQRSVGRRIVPHIANGMILGSGEHARQRAMEENKREVDLS